MVVGRVLASVSANCLDRRLALPLAGLTLRRDGLDPERAAASGRPKACCARWGSLKRIRSPGLKPPWVTICQRAHRRPRAAPLACSPSRRQSAADTLGCRRGKGGRRHKLSAAFRAEFRRLRHARVAARALHRCVQDDRASHTGCNNDAPFSSDLRAAARRAAI
jgi:hypothetical protein